MHAVYSLHLSYRGFDGLGSPVLAVLDDGLRERLHGRVRVQQHGTPLEHVRRGGRRLLFGHVSTCLIHSVLLEEPDQQTLTLATSNYTERRVRKDADEEKVIDQKIVKSALVCLFVNNLVSYLLDTKSSPARGDNYLQASYAVHRDLSL
jgi:hypothetical protein